MPSSHASWEPADPLYNRAMAFRCVWFGKRARRCEGSLSTSESAKKGARLICPSGLSIVAMYSRSVRLVKGWSSGPCMRPDRYRTDLSHHMEARGTSPRWHLSTEASLEGHSTISSSSPAVRSSLSPRHGQDDLPRPRPAKRPTPALDLIASRSSYRRS